MKVQQQLALQTHEASYAGLQLLTQHDMDWLRTLAADFVARSSGVSEQEEEVRRRLNWHEWCSEHLWELHRREAVIEGRFSSAEEMLQHMEDTEGGDSCKCICGRSLIA